MEANDYANEIDPGIAGWWKIATAIRNLIQNHDFSGKRTLIYR